MPSSLMPFSTPKSGIKEGNECVDQNKEPVQNNENENDELQDIIRKVHQRYNDFTE